VKLAAVPAIAWGLARLMGFQGLEASVLVLCAALPTATNAYILAVRMTGDGRGRDPDYRRHGALDGDDSSLARPGVGLHECNLSARAGSVGETFTSLIRETAMQLGDQRGSDNIEDRRGIAGGGLGIGGVVIALIAMFWRGPFGDPQHRRVGRALGAIAEGAPQGAPADEAGQFVSKVLGSTEDVWTQIFKQSKVPYHPPTLVLYDGAVRSACGMGQAAMGPFYCPNDQKLYIDLAFYQDLKNRFHAPGDFAQAYVIAHEVGHHVQNQLGIMEKMEEMRARVSKTEYNQYSVRLELQADCFAGVWGHHAANANLLDPGDVEEGLTAATAIGDDRLQKQSQGYVVPESFTHGSSAQRVRWFKRGMDSGQMGNCDTFSSKGL
jgi:predicted metalloprotease